MLGSDIFTMFVNIVLHNFRLTSNLVAMGFDLRYLVKLWNTWFSMFLFIEYDDDYWIQNF